MEESEVDLRTGQDLQSQLQAIMEQQRGKPSRNKINTKHILFLFSGAFSGLEEIIQRRLGTHALGFAPHTLHPRSQAARGSGLLGEVTGEDLVRYGLEPEFVGRLPVRVACHALTTEEYFKILSEARGSIIHQYIQQFKSYGIDLRFTESALWSLAARASQDSTGARALMTYCERMLRSYKFELPSTPLKRLDVCERLVQDPEAHLTRLLQSIGHPEPPPTILA